MLIVSQNKEKIVNMDNCVDISIRKIYGDDEEINIIKNIEIIYESTYKNGTLGIYNTQKRAKEVLEEIVDTYKFNRCYAVGQKQAVYQMPEE